MKTDINAQNFYEEYKKEIENLLQVPLCAYVKINNVLVPYEYCADARLLRNRRLEPEVNAALSKNPRLLKFCIKNNINKEYLFVFKGGNLIGYIKMKEKFNAAAPAN